MLYEDIVPASLGMSASGLVSRVLPFHTAVRNCTRDEGACRGRQSGVDLKPPQAAVVKSDGGERCGNVGTGFRQARLREASASEPLQKCRNRIRRCQNRGLTLPPGSVREHPEACPSGIRHVGGTKLNQALGRNSLAQAMPQTPGGTAISVRHAYAVAASGLISTAETRSAHLLLLCLLVGLGAPG